MWTTKQANRFAAALDVAAMGVVAAMLVGFAAKEEWGVAASLVLIMASVGVRSWRRRRRGIADDNMLPVDGRARDERDAYIQLRAWAVVGQAAAIGSLVLVGVGAFQVRLVPWLLPIAGVFALYYGSILWQRLRG
jgi:hypothetical protein